MIDLPLSRLSALGVALLVAACEDSDNLPGDIDYDHYGVECALDGAEVFTKSCHFEPSPETEGNVQVIQHPDGGFRVFEYGETYSGLVSRDGAEDSVEIVTGDKVVVTVGDDRYRFDMPVSGE